MERLAVSLDWEEVEEEEMVVVWREGRMELRYSAGSKSRCRKAWREGSAT